MSDIDYKIFSDDSRAKLDRTRWAIAKAGYLGAEIPSSLEGKLRDAETQYEEAEKKFLFKDKEEAIRDVQKVNRYADAVSEAAEELYFKACFQKVCDVHDSYRDHKDLVAQCIPDYKVHKENLRDIKKRRENNGKLLWGQACSDNDQLQSFLDAFELVKEELSVAIKKAESAKWMARITIILAGLTLIVGTVVMVRGCSDSSQQVAQPEPSASESEITS